MNIALLSLAVPVLMGFAISLCAVLIRQQKQMVELLAEIKEEKDLRETLTQDLEKYKQAVDGASDHIIITDADGVILYANHGVFMATGFKPEEVVGQKAGSKSNWGGLMPQSFYKKLWNTIKIKKKAFRGEVQNKRKDGRLYTAYTAISPVSNKTGEIQFFVGIERDITKEKEIDKAKSEFVSVASHQLRTPLSAISWYSEMLLAGDAGKLNKTQYSFLKEIYRGNQRMTELVTSLLNVSRLELGTFAVEPSSQSLQLLVEEAIKEMRQTIKAKKLTITTKYAKLKDIKLDKKLMFMVLQNLLSNAVKYTPNGGKVALEILHEPPYAVLKIVDTGMGIPEEQQSKIFGKLYRATNAIEQATEGTGLGLYIAKQIVDATGGKISFTSKLNKGTIFTVQIPLKGMKVKTGEKKLN